LVVLDCTAHFFGPDQQLTTDVLRAVIDPERAGLSAPFDDPIKAPDDPLSGQRDVHLNPQPFAVEVVQHIQQPERAAITEAICFEAPIAFKGNRPSVAPHTGAQGELDHTFFSVEIPGIGRGQQTILRR
jgi:hypothetical protein